MTLRISESGDIELPEGVSPDKESQLELLMEESGELLNIVNSGNRYVAVNDRWTELTGYAKAEMLGTHVRNYFTDETIEKGRYITFTLWNSDRRASEFWRGEIVTREGDTIPIETKFALLPPTEDGDYNGLVEITRDIREQKRREEKLQVMSRVLRHNLRNELGSIRGSAEVLQTVDDPRLQQTAENIERTAENLMQTGTKVRKIQEQIQENPNATYETELTQHVEAVVEQFQEEYPGATVQTTLPADEVWANVPAAYATALEELVENAIVHTPEGRSAVVDVTLTVEDSRVLTHIDDTAAPIPQQEREVIRTGEETALSHSSGLGLWLANWIVETAGGQLRFDRSENGGNRVSMVLERV